METPSVAVRLNPFKGSDGPAGAAVPWSRHGRMLDERPNFTLDPLFHAGCYYVQDASAMFVGHRFRELLESEFKERSGLRVLDLCAAPGGKTTDLATSLRERFGGDFLLVGNEVMRHRSRVLADNVRVWGDPNVIVTSSDPAVFGQAAAGEFDVIVADVPCSGEGMFRKDPRAKEQWSPELVEICAARQKRILADSWAALRQGGVLLYSTCTYERAENDDILEWAAGELGGEIIPPKDEFAEFGVEMTGHGNLLRAGKVRGEGQWAGALRKTSAQKERCSKELKGIYIIGKAAEKGIMKGKDFVPDPDYALSLDYDRSAYPEVELDLHDALRYLHRDSLVLPDAAPGYNAVCYKGHPLGFVKNLGTRCNNLLPKSRKILMDI